MNAVMSLRRRRIRPATVTVVLITDILEPVMLLYLPGFLRLLCPAHLLLAPSVPYYTGGSLRLGSCVAISTACDPLLLSSLALPRQRVKESLCSIQQCDSLRSPPQLV